MNDGKRLGNGRELGNENALDPAKAMAEATRIARSVGRRVRWTGWVWLVIAVATPLFFLGTSTDWLERPARFWVAIAFMVVTGALAVAAVRREARGEVEDRRATRIDGPVTWAYVAVVLTMVVLDAVFDTSGAPLWFVVGSLATAVPPLVGAWRILVR